MHNDGKPVQSAPLYSAPHAPIPGIDGQIRFHPAPGDETGRRLVDLFHFAHGATLLFAIDVDVHDVDVLQAATLARYALRAYAAIGCSAQFAIRYLNDVFLDSCAFDEVEALASVFFGIIDAQRTTLQYVSAGHEPAFLVTRDGTIVRLETTAPPIGAVRDPLRYRQHTVALDDGALVVIATGALLEARDRSSDVFGPERLEAVLTRVGDRDPDAIGVAIERAVADFAGGAGADTALVIARIGREPPA